MKKLILLIQVAILFLALPNAYSQSGWFQQQSGTNYDLRSIFFVNSNTGWVVGEHNTILKTTNSGVNWNSQSAGYNLLRNVFFFNENTGWVVGGRVGWNYVDRIIMKTTNSGLNWFTLMYNVSSSVSPLSTLYFVNSLTGFVGSYNGGILKTTNGGTNFFNLGVNHIIAYSIFFNNVNTGYAGGETRIYKTTDGGSNWMLNFYDDYANIASLQFVNLYTGYAVGHRTVIKTTNGGYNWISLLNNPDFLFRNYVFFSDTTHGSILVGYNIERTTNGGVNWIHQYNSGSIDLLSIYFTDNNTGWVCGFNGTILKTTTGGFSTSIKNINSKFPSAYTLYQNYPNPFNPATNIKFDIQKTSPTKLAVYDALGREVATLVNEELKAGSYQTDWDGSNYTSGVYFYRLQAGEYIETKKMLMIK